MALTISTGFVVDDAIVVIENITRHIEAGMRPMEAALLGAGNRFHSAVDEHVADGGVHSDSDDGRNRGAAVPRICGDAEYCDCGVVGGVADNDSDDVREMLADRK